jgi:hypothetical protein
MTTAAMPRAAMKYPCVGMKTGVHVGRGEPRIGARERDPRTSLAAHRLSLLTLFELQDQAGLKTGKAGPVLPSDRQFTGY